MKKLRHEHSYPCNDFYTSLTCPLHGVRGWEGGGDGGDPYESETIRLHSLQAMTYSVDNVPSLKAVKLVVVGFG